VEEKTGLTLSDSQKTAVAQVLKSKVSVITVLVGLGVSVGNGVRVGVAVSLAVGVRDRVGKTKPGLGVDWTVGETVQELLADGIAVGLTTVALPGRDSAWRSR